MTGTLLTTDLLVMQQITAVMGNDFDILDADGAAVGVVTTTGSMTSRFLAGNRTLEVTEAHGAPVLTVRDPLNFVRDTFELSDASGAPLAHVRKRFTVFKRRVDIEIDGGPTIELHGNLLGFDFDFREGGRVLATVSRKWAGFGRGFLGHSRYTLRFEPGTAQQMRAAIIGGTIALDLLRAKEDKSS